MNSKFVIFQKAIHWVKQKITRQIELSIEMIADAHFIAKYRWEF